MHPRKIVKKIIPRAVFGRMEPFGHRAEAAITQFRHGYPAKGLRVIGVTGSAGKTTTVTLIASILRAAGYKVAYFTTAQVDFGDGKPQINLTRMTTVEVGPLLRNIAKARREHNIDFLILETTAHALQQGRVLGIKYEMGVLTNFSHEHLDYFGTMPKYLAAKQLMFKKLRRSHGTAIINADDDYAKDFLKIAPKDITYGLHKTADVYATDVKGSVDGNAFILHVGKQATSIRVGLPGLFNVYNCLAAAATCLQLGVGIEDIAAGIAKLANVPGRMERYRTSAGFTAIIDFAHTPDSFEKLFKELRPVTKGRMIALFGCAGERDKARRPIQGKLAADYCEVIILTEDDPRSESNEQITREIQAGIKQSKKHPQVIVNPIREDAIKQAVSLARKNDVILLLSKGPERTIEKADGPKSWNELKALKDALKSAGIRVES
ncbi:MAG TPA: UDP-N-acetylmuramoyl-L-alanyl-D-glutamate--2,6-diaminopimelate ligase [Candidatus Saccharimonadales bacterium]|nr:UDP-N-acetylmuramoyl-L-alanyl-D-glutamate--2,6-diaminopimelate ligase [Candidatus Saccharimonadales bacterium]